MLYKKSYHNSFFFAIINILGVGGMEIGSGIFFPISAIAFILIIVINLLVKPNINSVETRLYKVIAITNLFGLILELLCTVASMIRFSHPLLSDLILKLY